MLPKVEIALLDTGVELSDRQRRIYENEERIVYRSWIHDDKQIPDIRKDKVGHGTHLTTLLAQVAPNAVIHVARVFEKRKINMQTEPKNVAHVSAVIETL